MRLISPSNCGIGRTLTRKEFPKSVKDAAWDRCDGFCERKDCTREIERHEAEFDHVLACGLGGDATLANCEVLCPKHHRQKTGTHDIPRMAKADRARAKIMEGKKRKSRPIPGSRGTKWKKKLSGEVVER